MKWSVELSLAGLLDGLASPASRRAYRSDWELFTAWLEQEALAVLEARPRDIERYVGHLRDAGKAKATTGRALSVIREVYARLVRDELIEVNPAREIKNPKVSTAPKTPWLTEEQVKTLLDVPADTWKDRRDRLCLCLLFGLGWRRAEVARMRVEDFRDGTVTGVVKGGKEVTVGVPDWLWRMIEEWRAYARLDEGPLLPRSAKKRSSVSADVVYQIVKKAVQRAGLPAGISPHALRRTNITLAGERGVSLKERQLAVGHSSQGTTERYDKARDAAKSAPGQVFEDLVKKESK